MNRVTQHPVRAFAVALIAVAALSLMDAVMKHLVLAIGIVAVSVWRAVANMTFAAALYLPTASGWPSRSNLKVHVARSVVIVVMAFLFFWGIGRVPLAQAIALTFIAPLIALLLAAVTLHEKIGRRSAAGSAVAFAGVLVIVLGQARADFAPGVLLGTAAIVGSALCYAVNIVLMRHQALSARPLEINFYQGLTIVLVWILSLPFVGVPQWPGGQLLWVGIASVLSTSGTLLFAWAYARGEAGYLAATEYSGFLWASALGWLVFREPVSPFTLAGAVLIVGGCFVAAGSGTARRPKPEIEAVA